ncbi:hypothetical protein COEREDRAFT_82935 [Coemansia reversa NRRL 1564]|uniref:DUF1640-domain-containing protein n=1 Tax=Coemansia reversa (strain ATCC 12441 / NRRL 1564) TaxID=763665 RepID=A0A2G5B513_COERN|nr:hypothetical protein COEREDRAFT_82935 [Coemansia reversa NRRL 1564]|eukprot:PIA14108.1 hypothetical protein COEREDRAFT_82935 [Coemansia reversa NRRL 1564]
MQRILPARVVSGVVLKHSLLSAENSTKRAFLVVVDGRWQRQVHTTRFQYESDTPPSNTLWPTAESVILQRISSTSTHPSLAILKAKDGKTLTKADRGEPPRDRNEKSVAKDDNTVASGADGEERSGESMTVSGIINSVRESRGAKHTPPEGERGKGQDESNGVSSGRGRGIKSKSSEAFAGDSALGEYHIPYCLFNTNSLVNQLMDAGLTLNQATLIMTLVKYRVYETMEQLKSNMLTKSDLENDAYLFRAALQELRTETQMIRKNDQAILESQAAAINRDIESLAQRLNDEIANLRSDIQIELNNHKHDSSHEMKNLDMELHALASKYQVVMGEMKTDIEAVKLESIRRGLLAAVITTLSLLAIIWGPELLHELNMQRKGKGDHTGESVNNAGSADSDLDNQRSHDPASSTVTGDSRGGYGKPGRAGSFEYGGLGGIILPQSSPTSYSPSRGRLLFPADNNGASGYSGADESGSNDRGPRYRNHSHLNIQYDPTISAAEGHFGYSQQPPSGTDVSKSDNYDDWFDSYFYPPQDIAEHRARSGTSASLMDSDPTFDSAHWRSSGRADKTKTSEVGNNGSKPLSQNDLATNHHQPATSPTSDLSGSNNSLSQANGQRLIHIPLHFQNSEPPDPQHRQKGDGPAED